MIFLKVQFLVSLFLVLINNIDINICKANISSFTDNIKLAMGI